MTYATQQDLIDRFGSQELIELTDRASTGAIDATVITRALNDADAEINGYLAGRYSLPLATTPPALSRMACDIARYRLYEDRATEAVTQRYKDAVRFLDGIAKGLVSLGLNAAGTAPEAASGGVKTQGKDRVFTMGDSDESGTLDDY